jgi:predicted nucleic acid-binding protein
LNNILIYIDTSSLMKLFILDAQSKAVILAIAQEAAVVISPLTELEAFVQLRAAHLGGCMGAARYSRVRGELAKTLESEPFLKRSLVSRVFSSAMEQNVVTQVHCRSLDRLHLAAMAELGVRRLMTHDVRQAEGARELGYEVVMPGA